ncbi:PAS domain S-box-containing protein/diguanylate cyclase (GGDEF)-like protein [Serratia fonticola]|uniref:PAS domain S-box-containing protein/diguanylate cyclase (GGDEF)-like protein n=1 Tax=Serratia fonticola TaxID=47917 RepID=A0A542CZN1_SERFO|nr:diguanylate cyclase [Serratia fonticola]TQI81702.1 PAS domain S-box-containing protein/diguanylate cyclase (GGDEF)-like protein [Serratia fonticola]TQI96274.1 PAS domain S-box-containing protein/diguanylate cyclase (GGDEF)-like protein [Serratia fonticola]TVZ70772.1 PAS domain S-box-containing protein/diguanylate cyclase (GGDEF)-like protein [Serratia fonticola]
MIEPCMPANESLRQMALDSLRILDSHALEKLDRITRLAASYFGVPIALISLIDRDRQWFLSRFGLDVKETPRKISFCAHTILQQDALIVPNVANDMRFADNPLVKGEPHIGFYVGQPLLSLEGLPLGTLCLIDRQPRTFTQQQVAELQDFAEIIEEYLHSLERSIYTESLKSDLQRSEAMFEQTFFQAAVGMALVSLEGYWLRVNPRICELLGYSEQKLLTLNFQDITHPDDLDSDLELLQQLLANEIATYSMEKRYFRGNGSTLWVELTVALHRLPDGSPGHFISVLVDISERKLAETNLRTLQHELEDRVISRTEELSIVVNKLNLEIEHRMNAQHQLNAEKERLRAITDNMPALISQVGPDEVYQFANSAYQRWFGIDEASLKTMTLRQFMGEKAYHVAKPMIEKALQGQTVSFENELQTQTGSLMIHTTLVPCETQGFYILSMDISELKRLQRRLEYDVTHDLLTGLPNRRAFLHQLAQTREECLNHGHSMAVLFIDLDGFKQINDNLGHDYGDVVLKTFAKLLTGCIHNAGFVARLAGDEFTAVLWRLSEPRIQISHFCENVLVQLAALTQIGGREMSLSASIGAAIYSGEDTTVKALLVEADTAMYRAKSAGKGKYSIY